MTVVSSVQQEPQDATEKRSADVQPHSSLSSSEPGHSRTSTKEALRPDEPVGKKEEAKAVDNEKKEKKDTEKNSQTNAELERDPATEETSKMSSFASAVELAKGAARGLMATLR